MELEHRPRLEPVAKRQRGLCPEVRCSNRRRARVRGLGGQGHLVVGGCPMKGAVPQAETQQGPGIWPLFTGMGGPQRDQCAENADVVVVCRRVVRPLILLAVPALWKRTSSCSLAAEVLRARANVQDAVGLIEARTAKSIEPTIVPCPTDPAGGLGCSTAARFCASAPKRWSAPYQRLGDHQRELAPR